MVDMMGRLHVDLFLQDKFLINGVDVKIRLVRSKSAFALMAGGVNPDYKIQIVNATLFAKKATMNPTVQMAHIKALEKSTVKYPMRSVECKVYSIPAGTRSHTYENLFLGTLPKRLVQCCIDNDAYNGAYDKNPFHGPDRSFAVSYPKTIDGTLPAAFVCNTDDGDEPGEHWIALYLDADGRGDYFCSYGLPP